MNPMQEYTLATFRALNECLIPDTPNLARRYGDAQLDGAQETGLEKNLYESFNNLMEMNLGPFESFFDRTPTVPIAPTVALLLDYGALEYILTRELEDEPSVGLPGGAFSWLSPEDRRETIDFLDSESSLQTLNDVLDSISPYSGFMDYLIRGIVSVPLITYYSEWDGYDQPDGKRIPDPESFSEQVQSWNQTGFPGLEDGHAALMGYEVEEFEENEY